MNERRNRKPQRTSPLVPMLMALIAVGVVFFIFLGVKALREKQPEDTDAVASLSTAERLASDTPAPTVPSEPVPSSTEQLPPDTQPVVTTAPIVVTTETPTTVPVTTEPPGPTMMTVDDSYFADALLIGDSRTDGLRLYSNPGEAKHFCATSLNIYKVMNSEEEAYGYKGIRNLLKNEKFGKIYIMFGINECGYPTASFFAKYKEVVEEIRSYQPDALIYIQSIGYVTQKKESKDPVFASSNIKEKNEAIKALANRVDIFYLEVNDAMNDGTDHLPADYTGDGVHLKASYYKYWRDYLYEHAVVDAKHPWTPSGDRGTTP